MGVSKAQAIAAAVAKLNTLLHPGAGKEDPVKARIDQDAVEVATKLMTGDYGAPSHCGARAGYVLGA
jgi:hypothetical protein